MKVKANFTEKSPWERLYLASALIYKAELEPSQTDKQRKNRLIKRKGDRMEEICCKKCGRPLHDPESIARGMGPECAGVAGGRRMGYGSSRRIHRGSAYLLATGIATYPTIFTLVEKEEQLEQILVVEEEGASPGPSDALRQFPADLVELVLSAPAPGAIAFHTKMDSRRKNKQPGSIHPGKTLKEIRRMCIEIRLAFWPGISDHGRPVACVPYGENDWKFDNSEKVLSRDELEGYLARYGMISSDH
jgi:hypothetical protein